jgi:hypothetical protein
MRPGVQTAALALTAGLLLSIALAHGAVPVRLDEPEPAAPLELSSGPVKLVNDVSYQNRVQLEVTPDSTESYLSFNYTGDITFQARSSAVAVKSDGTNVALAERVFAVSIIEGVGAFSDFEDPYSSNPALILSVDFDFDSETVTLTVKTPADHPRVLLDVDVFTGSPVTFVDLV